MKHLFNAALLSLIFLTILSCQESKKTSDYPIQPVPFTQVELTDNFWKSRLETNNRVTIPYAFEQCEETGRLKNFRVAGGLEEGGFNSRYPFDDSDVFKIMEGAAYALQEFPDDSLEAFMDTLISWVAAAQEEDGYLYTYRTILGDKADTGWVGSKRWEKVDHHSHELYNIGHMYEAAVAHYNATGKRNFLDIALKSANLVCEDFGKGKIEKYPGHQEIEIGLIKLYRTTGDERYFDLAKFFLDIRDGGDDYNQAHKPVTRQELAFGHSVRACYMYAGMADVAAMTGNEDYNRAIQKIWNDVNYGKLYVTGGIGSVGSHEGFGEPYDLPNATAYCETCAGIANVLWNHRMFLQYGDSKYIDILERSLYNNVLSGISLEGDRFFYANRLESHGDDQRSEWFACACCPSNICRFIPSVQGYIYAKDKEDIYVNLYVSSDADIYLERNQIRIEQSSLLPWEGESRFQIYPENKKKFAIHFRIPGWASGEVMPSDLYESLNVPDNKPEIYVNGERVDYSQANGYAILDRTWASGDEVGISLPMEILKVRAHEKVTEDRGKLAIQRGPLVYCAEWADNQDGSVLDLEIDPNESLNIDYNPDLLNGIVMIKGTGTGREFSLIPYYSWAHRGKGEMTVWLEAVDEIDAVYEDPSNWLHVPDGKSMKDVDVFYLYPTTYSKPEGSEKTVSDIKDPGMRSGARKMLASQASVFQDECNIYAPYYPQIDAGVGLNLPIEQKNALMDTGVVDYSIAAFEYYLEHFNHGRPFFIAGHSQGSNVLLLMMKKIFDDPDLQEKLIAAYLVGYSVTSDDTLNYPFLKFAKGKDDVGVVVSWNTEAKEVEGRNPVLEKGSLCINPLSWETNDKLASRKMNLGAVFFDNETGDSTVIRRFTSAKINPGRGTLMALTPDPEDYIYGKGELFPKGVYHPMDYSFFYNNLKENIGDRKKAFLEK